MHVTLLSYVSGNEQMIGTVRVDANGQLSVVGKVPPGMRQVVQDAFDRAPTPEAFLRTLPLEFKGAYHRAVLVKDQFD